MSFKFCGMLRSRIPALLLLFSSATQAAPPDLANGGVQDSTIPINLGSARTRGGACHDREDGSECRQIMVRAADVGSPADGRLSIGDVIPSANATGAAPVNFSADSRPSFADGINDAEARGPAGLKVLRRRAGTTSTETLTLGAYAPAANIPGVTVVKNSPAAGTDTVTLTLPRAADLSTFVRLKVIITP